MATIIANGCFDVFHEGHRNFLRRALFLGAAVELDHYGNVRLDCTHWPQNRLLVAVNSDESARKLKAEKWGAKYPVHDLQRRMGSVAAWSHEVVSFDTEDQLEELIWWNMPCILVKGPDYAGKHVTGDETAPVLILDTPEPESVKQMKRKVYAI